MLKVVPVLHTEPGEFTDPFGFNEHQFDADERIDLADEFRDRTALSQDVDARDLPKLSVTRHPDPGESEGREVPREDRPALTRSS